jgi:L-fuconolactonase
MPRRIIDTHIHVWNFDKADYPWLKGNTTILNRTYHIEELNEEVRNAEIVAGVLVQAANNTEDTNLMLEVAAKTDWIKGVVGWLPLMHPAETEKLIQEEYGRNKYFKGIRHLIHDEADPRWLLQDKVMQSLEIVAGHDLTYDVVGILPEHIATALKVAESIPSLKMVFDHLNQPPIASAEKFGRWGELMMEASRHKNFYAKISGLGTTAQKENWGKDDIKPYIEFVIDHFGTDRCFCGSDWPVSLLAGDYGRTWNHYFEAIDSLLKEEQREKVYYENAVKFYRLQ